MSIPSHITFADDRLEKEFHTLASGDDRERVLYITLLRAFQAVEKDAFAGTQLAERLIPKTYGRYRITNLWKYDLVDGWRLLYTIEGHEIVVLSIILEWLDHKEYERRLKY